MPLTLLTPPLPTCVWRHAVYILHIVLAAAGGMAALVLVVVGSWHSRFSRAAVACASRWARWSAVRLWVGVRLSASVSSSSALGALSTSLVAVVAVGGIGPLFC